MWLFALAMIGCRDTDDRDILVQVPVDHAEIFDDYIRFIDDDRIAPLGGGTAKVGSKIILSTNQDIPAQSYMLVMNDETIAVQATDVLGWQYGLADVLERKGYRFFHPHKTFHPDTFTPVSEEGFGEIITPEMGKRRGLHMHTLHPTEGLYDFWLPPVKHTEEGGEERAQRVMDWVVKNRGNHIQWVALDDVTLGDDDGWENYTTRLVDYAHDRGMTAGLAVQLFGSGNLQKAFDLIEASDQPNWEEVDRRIKRLTDPGVDMLNLSFGEFLGEDPEQFVELGTDAVNRMNAKDVEVATTIHVGDLPELRVDYGDKEGILYYFLADWLPATPWVHTVMFYNLYEDAGLAYHHEDFEEHRQYLVEKVNEDAVVGYFPESAYWVAFDVSVPQYFPVYVASRQLDMERLKQDTAGSQGLQDHVLFSSGWEWGFWQNDYATLRMNHTLTSAEEMIEHMLAPLPDGPALAQAVNDLMRIQQDALIEGRLAAFVAGRDSYIDLGDTQNIIAQPDRMLFTEVAEATPAEREALDDAITRLEAYAAQVKAIEDVIEGLASDGDFAAEIYDGTQISAIRPAYVAALYRAAMAYADGEDPAPFTQQADDLLTQARATVDRRHANLHWSGGDRIIATEDTNPTIYPFGYLGQADDLCYWRREQIRTENVVTGTGTPLPGCI